MPRGKKPRPLIYRFWSRVDKNGPIHPVYGQCWMWTGWCERGGWHGRIPVGGTGGRLIGAHRASWQIVNGSVPGGMQVLHRCDNPPCVNPAHLFLGTHGDNMDDKIAKGRQRGALGEANAKAKLTAAVVAQIRTRLAKGERQSDIAADYGVQQALVSKIKRNQVWKHI